LENIRKANSVLLDNCKAPEFITYELKEQIFKNLKSFGVFQILSRLNQLLFIMSIVTNRNIFYTKELRVSRKSRKVFNYWDSK